MAENPEVRIGAAARRLLDEHRRRAPFQPLAGDLRPRDTAEAYRVQDALIALSASAGGGAIGGWKIALTSKVMREMVGLHESCAGAILARTIHRSPARFSAADFVHLGLEFEIAIRLGRDLPGSGAPYGRESVAGAVAACVPAFELVEDRGAEYRGLDGITLIADNCWNAGIVQGVATGDWRAADLTGAPSLLAVNGEPAGEGRAGDAMGHPFEALAWVANHLAGRGRGLRAGEVVMTGSVIQTLFPKPGDRAVFTVEGLGEAVVELVR